jgi:hypothetical protein
VIRSRREYYRPVLQGRQNLRDGFRGHISSDRVFNLELLFLLVQFTADDVEIDGINDEILKQADRGDV